MDIIDEVPDDDEPGITHDEHLVDLLPAPELARVLRQLS
jgi:hypothetical protein